MEQKVHRKQCNTRFVLTTGSFPVILLAIVIYVVAKKVHIFFHVLKDAKEKLAASNSKKGLVLLVAMVRKHEQKCLKVGRPPVRSHMIFYVGFLRVR